MIASPMPFPGMPYKKGRPYTAKPFGFCADVPFFAYFYFIFAISQAILLAALALL